MDTDLALTIGIVLLVLAVPASLAAWAESRMPRIGLVLLIGAVGFGLFALIASPEGYAPADIPGVMLGVLARLVN